MIKFTLPRASKSSIDIDYISRKCPKCFSYSHIHGKYLRNVSDPIIPTVEQVRLKCPKCNFSWFVYADGIRKYSGRTVHMVFIGILLYSFGLSFDKVSIILQAFLLKKIAVKSTIWNDFQRSGKYLQLRNIFTTGRRSPAVISTDGTYVRIKGKKACITFINDTDDNMTIAIELANERDEEELVTMFHELADELGLTGLHTICSDGNTTISALVDNLNGLNSRNDKVSYHRIQHALCGAHSKKNYRKRINEYIELTPEKDLNHKVIDKLNKILEQNYPAAEQEWLRQAHLDHKSKPLLGKILHDMYLNYEKYSIYNDINDIPFTNNLSERNFIESKQRYKLTRGFKSKEGCLNYFRNLAGIFQGKINEEYFQYI